MGKSLNRMSCEVFQSDFVSVARFNFQACSFNHSDISPLWNLGLRAAKHQSIACRLRLHTSLTSHVNPALYGLHAAAVRESVSALEIC